MERVAYGSATEVDGLRLFRSVGLRRYVHLKETEWRYNHRRADKYQPFYDIFVKTHSN